MGHRIEKVGAFRAITGDGQIFELSEYQEFISAASHNNAHAEIPGLKSFRTVDGKAANALGNGRFRIVEDGIDVTRLD